MDVSHIVLLTLSALGLAYIVGPSQKPKAKKTHSRRMSYFSEILAHPSGTYPAKNNVPNLPSEDELLQAMNRVLLSHHRFASFVQEKSESYYFTRTDVDLKHHLVNVSVKDEEGILSHVESCFKRTWTAERAASRPLWYIHRISNVSNGLDGGKSAKVTYPMLCPPSRHGSSSYDLNSNSAPREQVSAVLVEVHHALGDGMSILDLFRDLLTNKDGTSELAVLGHKFAPKSKKSLIQSLGQTVSEVAFLPLRLIGLVGTAIKLILLSAIWADSPTVLKPNGLDMVFTGTRRLYTLPPVSLELIKQVKTKLGVTVNDVVTGLLGGALRKYMELKKDPLLNDPHLQIRGMMPYSFPRVGLDSDDLMRNIWIAVSVCLPVHATSSLSPVSHRIRKAKETMDKLKNGGDAYVAAVLQKAAYTLLGYDFTVNVCNDLMARHSLVFTNVPGFAGDTYLCGKKVTLFQPMVTNAVSQVSLVSTGTGIYMNYVVDPVAIPDAETIGGFFVDELVNVSKELNLNLPVLV